MDKIKLLGSLLGNDALNSPVGSKILDSLLGGKGSGGGADILGTLLGGGKRSGGGGLGALGGILDAASRGKAGGGPGGGMDVLGGLLSSVLGGGGSSQPSRSSGGGGNDILGSILGSVLGGGGQPASQSRSSSGGGIAGVLGGILGGGGGGNNQPASAPAPAPSGGGGIGDLLGGLFGGPPKAEAKGSELLAGILGGARAEPQAPPKEAHDEAEILIRAMLNAAKADGKIDDAERQKILSRLGDLDQEEIDFIQEELSKPLDLDTFVKDVPDEMDRQVYSFSLMAVKLDTQNEAQYFANLARGLGMDGDTCNDIHEKLGQPEIFA